MYYEYKGNASAALLAKALANGQSKLGSVLGDAVTGAADSFGDYTTGVRQDKYLKDNEEALNSGDLKTLLSVDTSRLSPEMQKTHATRIRNVGLLNADVRAQGKVDLAAEALKKKEDQQAAVGSVLGSSVRNTDDIAVNNRILQMYEADPEGFAKKYGDDQKGQSDFSKTLQSAATSTGYGQGEVYNSKEYAQQMTDDMIAQGVDPVVAMTAASKKASMFDVTPTSNKQAQEMMKAKYTVEKDVISGKLKTLDKMYSSVKSSKKKNGSFKNTDKGWTSLFKQTSKEFPDTDRTFGIRWTGDLGGSDLKDTLKVLQTNGVHPEDVSLALTYASDGTGDGAEVDQKVFETKLDVLRKNRQGKGTNYSAYGVEDQAYKASRADLLKQQEKFGNAYVQSLTPSTISTSTQKSRVDELLRDRTAEHTKVGGTQKTKPIVDDSGTVTTKDGHSYKKASGSTDLLDAAMGQSDAQAAENERVRKSGVVGGTQTTGESASTKLFGALPRTNLINNSITKSVLNVGLPGDDDVVSEADALARTMAMVKQDEESRNSVYNGLNPQQKAFWDEFTADAQARTKRRIAAWEDSTEGGGLVTDLPIVGIGGIGSKFAARKLGSAIEQRALRAAQGPMQGPINVRNILGKASVRPRMSGPVHTVKRDLTLKTPAQTAGNFLGKQFSEPSVLSKIETTTVNTAKRIAEKASSGKKLSKENYKFIEDYLLPLEGKNPEVDRLLQLLLG